MKFALKGCIRTDPYVVVKQLRQSTCIQQLRRTKNLRKKHPITPKSSISKAVSKAICAQSSST